MAPTTAENPTSLIKKVLDTKKKVDKWDWTAFNNPARSDGIRFSHWAKKKEDAEPYAFARFNRKVDLIPRYSDQEYHEFVAPLSDDWTKAETDHLWLLCEQFDLRFIVIADRFYGPVTQEEEVARKRDAKALSKREEREAKLCRERTVDELKERYYSVSKVLLETRGNQEHPICKKPFVYDQEVRRKCNLEKLFMRTKEQHEKERALLQEAKKIEQKIKKEEKEEKQLRKIIHADQGEKKEIVPVPEDDDLGKGGRRDRGSGVYLRSQRLSAPLPVSEKMNQKMETVLNELKVKATELKPTERVVDLYDDIRKEVLKLFQLQKFI